MHKEATVILSAEDAQLIMQVLRTAPIKGNLESLPTVLDHMIQIIKKLDAAFNSQE
jgi:hypothetical protein